MIVADEKKKQHSHSGDKIVGIAGLSSSKEEVIVKLLAQENLERVNAVAAPVHPRSGIYVKYIKRLLDLLIAVPAFIILLPVNAVLGIGTFLDVGRPIFFWQTRVGKDGKLFKIVKFRNMTNDKDENGVLLPPSQRVTKWGKFVRKYSLDELLNFWSVIKGDMSIIGPRPLPVSFLNRYSERHKMRHAVKPGLECPRVTGDENMPTYQRQFENDIWYVEHVSFLTDCKMVLHLFKMVFSMNRRTKNAAAASYFVGYDDDLNAVSMKKTPQKYLDLYDAYMMEQGDPAEKAKV